MTEKFPSTGFNSIQSSLFTHSQLRQVLSAYAEGVLQKGWKDYAISCEANQTTFCVIERGEGQPMAVIYSISATKVKDRVSFRVFDGQKPVHRSEKFLETLEIFRQLGRAGGKKNTKFKIIK